MNAQRITLSRKKGWRMPENTIKACRPGPLGNLFKVGRDGDAAECVCKFKTLLEAAVTCKWESAPFELRLVAALDLPGSAAPYFFRIAARLRSGELRGKNLACWCKPWWPCHADVLIDLANDQAERRG